MCCATMKWKDCNCSLTVTVQPKTKVHRAWTRVGDDHVKKSDQHFHFSHSQQTFFFLPSFLHRKICQSLIHLFHLYNYFRICNTNSVVYSSKNETIKKSRKPVKIKKVEFDRYFWENEKNWVTLSVILCERELRSQRIRHYCRMGINLISDKLTSYFKNAI